MSDGDKGGNLPTLNGRGSLRIRGGLRGRPAEHAAYTVNLFRAADRRSGVGRELHQTADELFAAQGGREYISPQRRILTERAAVLTVKARLLEQAILSAPQSDLDTLYLSIVSSLRKTLQTLGLDRTARDMGFAEPIPPHVAAIKELEGAERARECTEPSTADPEPAP